MYLHTDLYFLFKCKHKERHAKNCANTYSCMLLSDINIRNISHSFESVNYINEHKNLNFELSENTEIELLCVIST